MKEPGSFYVARRGELFDGPTWQCNHATLPLPQALQPFQNLKSLSSPGAYIRTPSSPARSASHRRMGKAVSLLRPQQPLQEDEAGKMELRKRPRPPRIDPDFVSSPPPMKRARKQAAAPTKPKEAAGPAKRRLEMKTPRRPAVGIGCPVAGLHRVTCRHQPPLRMSTRVLFRPRRPFNW